MANKKSEYCLTINNYSCQDVIQVQKLKDSGKLSHGIIGIEGCQVGKTPHLQMSLRFSCSTSWKEVKALFPRAHIERARCYEASVSYCKKEHNYTIY